MTAFFADFLPKNAKFVVFRMKKFVFFAVFLKKEAKLIFA